MDALKDALMKRRMKSADLDNLDHVDHQDLSLAEAQHGLMGSDQEEELHDKGHTDLAPEIDKSGHDQAQAAQDMQVNPMDGPKEDELEQLTKMFNGGSDMRNKGFMGKAAAKINDRIAMLKRK